MHSKACGLNWPRPLMIFFSQRGNPMKFFFMKFSCVRRLFLVFHWSIFQLKKFNEMKESIVKSVLSSTQIFFFFIFDVWIFVLNQAIELIRDDILPYANVLPEPFISKILNILNRGSIYSCTTDNFMGKKTFSTQKRTEFLIGQQSIRYGFCTSIT